MAIGSRCPLRMLGILVAIVVACLLMFFTVNGFDSKLNEGQTCWFTMAISSCGLALLLVQSLWWSNGEVREKLPPDAPAMTVAGVLTVAVRKRSQFCRKAGAELSQPVAGRQ